MTDTQKSFFELVGNLKKRGGMYVQPLSFETVVSFISGFNYGTSQCGASSELDRFVDWLDLRVGHHCSLHWSAVIRDVVAKRDTQVALQKLFELLEEFKNAAETKASRTGEGAGGRQRTASRRKSRLATGRRDGVNS